MCGAIAELCFAPDPELATREMAKASPMRPVIGITPDFGATSARPAVRRCRSTS